MKWFLIAAALLVLPSLAVSAPADSVTTATHPNSLRAGMWALQFDVNGQLLDVDSFSGGLSIKRQFAPTWALRFGVGFSGRGATTTPDQDTHPDREINDDDYSVSLETVYQRYFNPDAVVNAYWGVGPLVDYSRHHTEQRADSLRAESTSEQWNVGAIVSLGAEWFFAKQLSLHGEYTASAVYFDSTLERETSQLGESVYYDRSERNGWSFGTSNAVRLGLSVYF